MLGLAVAAGAYGCLIGVGVLIAFAGADLSDDPAERLFELNALLGTALVAFGLGGFLVYSAASALGGANSSPLRTWFPWPAIVLLPWFIGVGQLLVNNPGAAPWLFPFVNIVIVSVPSVVAALVVARGYARANTLAWPVSWREWTTGFIYGAIGSTTPAAVLNTLYVVFGGALFIAVAGEGDPFELEQGLRGLPRPAGIALDLSVLSVVAPLNEEFWKGFLVALFFYRKGGAGRCFLWGVLAGAGFNLFETFQNSLGAVHPDVLDDREAGGQWWLFGSARAGAGVIHAAASGLAALGWYGLLRRRPRYLLGYPAGVLMHGSWNGLVYLVAGDAFLSEAGPDARVLDIAGTTGLVGLSLLAAALLWFVPRRVRDDEPAAIYRVLGMRPATAAIPPPPLAVAAALPNTA